MKRPFKVGDFVKLNPKYINIMSSREKQFMKRKLQVTHIVKAGCESGWAVKTKAVRVELLDFGERDSNWFMRFYK